MEVLKPFHDMPKYVALCSMLFTLLFFGCSKKDAEPVKIPPVTVPPVVAKPIFNFTANVTSVTDSSAFIAILISEAEITDTLKYSIRLNNQLVVENQQLPTFILKGLASETDYEGTVELKDQYGNVKTQAIRSIVF